MVAPDPLQYGVRLFLTAVFFVSQPRFAVVGVQFSFRLFDVPLPFCRAQSPINHFSPWLFGFVFRPCATAVRRPKPPFELQ
jgi:hypothetical protein